MTDTFSKEILFKENDLIEVKPEFIQDITYTNKPTIGTKYRIRTVFGGDIWTYGLNFETGGDTYINISHKHVKLTK